MHPLPAEFYQPRDTVRLARKLLGCILYVRHNRTILSARIVETEAYHGPTDRASHAHNNRRTARTEVMFEPGGSAYVYLCYGMHHLFNVVTGPADYPAAVLVRAVEPLTGIATMEHNRAMSVNRKQLTAGPASLTRAMGIDLSHNRLPLVGPRIWIEAAPFPITRKNILSSPRVGVAYAGSHALNPWRFRIISNPWTSPAEPDYTKDHTP